MNNRVKVHGWVSYSHWGLFRFEMMIVPEWFAMGMRGVDDEDMEWAEAR
jgi:hypothetical protein